MRTEYRNWLYRRYLSGGVDVEVDTRDVEVLGHPLPKIMDVWSGTPTGLVGAYLTGGGEA